MEKTLYQFKAKDSEIKKIPLCLGHMLQYFIVNNMRKLIGYLYDFSVDHDANHISDVKHIHKYVTKKHKI